ncbi:MAG: 6-pyruvoyl-tetrahydropterin synthase-related protein, partial [Patescibacteria group bacterium]
VLGRSLWGELGGLVCAIFYVYAPYRASDAYSRGAVGEFWALVFLPLIFWAILELVRKAKTKYLLFLALSYAGLLITHNITTMAFTPVAAAWGLFLVIYYKKWRLLPQLILGGLWGIGLAAFFILPVIFERNYVHVETMIMGYFNYLAHFVSLPQLFLSPFWGFGSSELGPYDDLSFTLGIFHWLAALAAFVLSFVYRQKEKLWGISAFLFLVFLVSSFMTHQKSVFIWNSLPFLAYFQFPWRFLVVATFAVSALAGLLAALAGKTKKLVAFFLVVGVIFLNAFYFNPSRWYNLTDSEKFSGELWEKQLTISIFDYLPKSAETPPDSKAPEFPLVLEGGAEIVDYQKGSDWQRAKVQVTKEAVLRFPLYYFPGFKAWIDGQQTTIDSQNKLGLITISVPSGEHEIYVKLKRTWPRKIGDIVSALSLIALGGVYVYARHFKKARQ